jgi:hypothetical protein
MKSPRTAGLAKNPWVIMRRTRSLTFLTGLTGRPVCKLLMRLRIIRCHLGLMHKSPI